jgi:hypothetical protein
MTAANVRLRGLALAMCCGVLVLAFIKTTDMAAGQGAISNSLPGQEDVSFWVNNAVFRICSSKNVQLIM